MPIHRDRNLGLRVAHSYDNGFGTGIHPIAMPGLIKFDNHGSTKGNENSLEILEIALDRGRITLQAVGFAWHSLDDFEAWQPGNDVTNRVHRNPFPYFNGEKVGDIWDVRGLLLVVLIDDEGSHLAHREHPKRSLLDRFLYGYQTDVIHISVGSDRIPPKARGFPPSIETDLAIRVVVVRGFQGIIREDCSFW